MVSLCFLYSTILPEVKRYLIDALSNIPEMEIFVPQTESEAELLPQIVKADIAIGWQISNTLLSQAKNLKLFISPYTGVSYLLKTFREVEESLADVVVVNAHGGAPLIAQHAMALLLCCLRGIVYHHEVMKAGKWNPGGEGVCEEVPSYDITKRRIGLFGYGHINKQVHEILSGFVSNVEICRNSWVGEEEKYPTSIGRYTMENMEDFFKAIDTVIIAAPLTEKTNGIIQEPHLRLLGKEGILVNVGRGKIVNEGALYNALNSGIISSAGLDVWYNYHPEPDNCGRHYPYSEKFHDLPNIIMSPHRADSPFNDLRRWDDIIENIRRYCQGRSDFLNVVSIEKGY